MFKILNNGQVLRLDIGETYEQWVPVGMQMEAQIIVDKTTAAINEPINISLTWLKVNLESGEWEPDLINQETFNLVAGPQMYQVSVSPGTQVVSFSTPGSYVIGVRNPGKGSRDVIVTVTQ